MRGVLAVAWLAGACSSPAPIPPPWPESADVDLRAEIEATEELTEPEGAGPATVEDDPGVPLVHALEGEAAGLTYIEVVLGDVDLDAALPMVLMLHGRGDRPRVPGGPFGCVATPMRIVMPRAPEPLGPGYTWLSVRVAEGRTEEISRQLGSASDEVAAMLRTVTTRRPTIGRPIVAGFSQGALLAFAVAVRHPDLVGAAFPLAGWLPPPLWPASAEGLPPIRAVHGADDETIPMTPTADAVAHLHGLGVDVELQAYAGVGHWMSREMNAQFERWLEQALEVQAPALADQRRDTSIELGLDAARCETRAHLSG